MLAVVFIVPYPRWYTLVDFVVVAGAVNFAIVNASVPVLRKIYPPDVERPFRIPAATAWSLVAFVSASLLIYWATWPVTLYALGVTLGGSLVFLYHAYRLRWKGIGLRHSAWIPVYIAGLIAYPGLGACRLAAQARFPSRTMSWLS